MSRSTLFKKKPLVRIEALMPAIPLLALLLFGCEGNAGRPGKELISGDLQAPVVDIILPLPNRPLFDRTVVEAYAGDNSMIESIRFLVDGSPDTIPPPLVGSQSETVWDCRLLPAGMHTLQARATDLAGRTGLSPLILLQKADTLTLPAKDTLRFYSPSATDIYTIIQGAYFAWPLPPADGQIRGFGVRFTPDRPCRIVSAGVRLLWKSEWQLREFKDSVLFLSALDGLPDSLLYSRAISQRPKPTGEEFNDWKIAQARAGGIPVDGEFFVAVTLAAEPTDTIAVFSDAGLWNNHHGVMLKGGEWTPFTGGSLVGFNPVIYAVVSY